VEPFGLSLSEAVMVDPQQRLLLEATASMLPSAAGTGALAAAVGVFVGISNPDYANIKMAATPIGVYSATGMTHRRIQCYEDLFLTALLSDVCFQLFTPNYHSCLATPRASLQLSPCSHCCWHLRSNVL
jgi:acyl transferase domain-containing protein